MGSPWACRQARWAHGQLSCDRVGATSNLLARDDAKRSADVLRSVWVRRVRRPGASFEAMSSRLSPACSEPRRSAW